MGSSGLAKILEICNSMRVADIVMIVLTVILVVLEIILVVIAARDIAPQLKEIRQEVTAPPDTPDLAILYPVNGQEVGETGSLTAITEFPGLRHYVVVTPTANRIDSLQRNPDTEPRDGVFTAAANYGDPTTCGEEFIVRLIATEDILTVETFDGIPPNAAVSTPVVVKRPPC